jgi:hypothetical protein
MIMAAIACVLMGALFVVGIARTIRVWVALKDLQTLPNLVQIHRVKKTASKTRPR